MKLYLVQHGKAASKEVDPERALTKEGLQEVKGVASFIKSLDLSVDYLWHSGKNRAVETAEILAEVITVEKELLSRDGIAPNDDVTLVRDEIVESSGDIMIVGHLPFLSKLASLLLTGSESANTVAFRNGGVVCLNRTDVNRWQVDWIVTPQLLG